MDAPAQPVTAAQRLLGAAQAPAASHLYAHATTSSSARRAEKLAMRGPACAASFVGELTNRRRGRVFSYQRYVEVLGSELEPAR